jgi:hypothetical protein
MNKFLLFISIILILISCKKQSEIYSFIEIDSPLTGDSYGIYDTIYIAGKVRSDIIIKKAIFSLVQFEGNNEVIVSQLNELEPNKTVFSFQFNKQLVKKSLVSGYYYIKLVIKSDNYEKSSFTKIFITELTKSTEAIYYTTTSNGLSLLYSLDKNFTNTFTGLSENNLFDFCINSDENLLFSMSDIVLKSFELGNTQNNLWQKTLYAGSNYFFKGSTAIYDNLVFINSADGHIYGYEANNYGTYRKSATLNNNDFCPLKYLKFGEKWIVYSKSYDGKKRIETLNYETGATLSYYEIDFEVLSILEYSENKVIIWGNKDTIAKICTLNVDNNIMYEISSIGNPIKSVAKTGNLEYIYSAANSLFKINMEYKSNSLYYENIDCDVIIFDEIDNRLIVNNETDLLVIDYNSKSLIFSHNADAKISLIKLQYNKN